MLERGSRIPWLVAAALVFAVGCERKDGKDEARKEGKKRVSTPESVEDATKVLGRIQPLETDEGGKVTRAGLVMDDEKILILVSEDPDVDWNALVGARLRIPGKIETNKEDPPGTLRLKLNNLDILEVAANVELEQVPIRDTSRVDPALEPMIRGPDGQLRTQEEIEKQEKAQEDAAKKSDEAPAAAPPAVPPPDQAGAAPVTPVAPVPPVVPETGSPATNQRTEAIQDPAPASPTAPVAPVAPTMNEVPGTAPPAGPPVTEPGKI